MDVNKTEDKIDGLSTVAMKTIQWLIKEKETYDENILPELGHFQTTNEQD
jgi:hypothetical protein